MVLKTTIKRTMTSKKKLAIKRMSALAGRARQVRERTGHVAGKAPVLLPGAENVRKPDET